MRLGTGVTRYQSGSGNAEFTSTTPSVYALVQPFASRPTKSATQQLQLALRLSRPTYESATGAVDRSTLNHFWSLSTVVDLWQVGVSYSGQATQDEATPANAIRPTQIICLIMLPSTGSYLSIEPTFRLRSASSAARPTVSTRPV